MNLLLHHDNAPFFTKDCFTKTQYDCRPPPDLLTRLGPCYFSLFPLLMIRHFNTTEVLEAQSQAVLNTITECDFQDLFKTCQKPWERCMPEKGFTSRVNVVSWPKVNF
jgi:hypothetical protein